jgi:hypothetical protein
LLIVRSPIDAWNSSNEVWSLYFRIYVCVQESDLAGTIFFLYISDYIIWYFVYFRLYHMVFCIFQIISYGILYISDYIIWYFEPHGKLTLYISDYMFLSKNLIWPSPCTRRIKCIQTWFVLSKFTILIFYKTHIYI